MTHEAKHLNLSESLDERQVKLQSPTYWPTLKPLAQTGGGFLGLPGSRMPLGRTRYARNIPNSYSSINGTATNV